jgi:hypothetical protein
LKAELERRFIIPKRNGRYAVLDSLDAGSELGIGVLGVGERGKPG